MSKLNKRYVEVRYLFLTVPIMLMIVGHVPVGAATWWIDWEQKVPQTEPQKESVTWNLPDTFTFYQGDLEYH